MLDPGKYNHTITRLGCAFFLVASLLLVGYGCRNKSTSSGQSEDLLSPWPVSQLTQDELVTRLSPYMQHPERDTLGQNGMIEYIIDKGWDMQRHSSGIYYQLLEIGDGPAAEWAEKVSVHYNGYLLSGDLFESSYQRQKPFSFYVGNVIAGWNSALQLMSVGSKGVFIIPSHLAYGSEGFGKVVGPHQHLIFEIERLPNPH